MFAPSTQLMLLPPLQPAKPQKTTFSDDRQHGSPVCLFVLFTIGGTPENQLARGRTFAALLFYRRIFGVPKWGSIQAAQIGFSSRA
jgi:hypothetical protein